MWSCVVGFRRPLNCARSQGTEKRPQSGRRSVSSARGRRSVVPEPPEPVFTDATPRRRLFATPATTPITTPVTAKGKSPAKVRATEAKAAPVKTPKGRGRPSAGHSDAEQSAAEDVVSVAKAATPRSVKARGRATPATPAARAPSYSPPPMADFDEEPPVPSPPAPKPAAAKLSKTAKGGKKVAARAESPVTRDDEHIAEVSEAEVPKQAPKAVAKGKKVAAPKAAKVSTTKEAPPAREPKLTGRKRKVEANTAPSEEDRKYKVVIEGL